jgi:hypothetical protein
LEAPRNLDHHSTPNQRWAVFSKPIEGSGDITQIGRDQIINQGVSAPKAFTIDVEGLTPDNRNVQLSIRNNDDIKHDFEISLVKITGGLTGVGVPDLRNKPSKYLRWEGAGENESKTIGPHRAGIVTLAIAGESNSGSTPYRVLKYPVMGMSQAELGKFYSRVPLGGFMDYEIEIQAVDGLLDRPERETWTLEMGGRGIPGELRPSTPDTPRAQS